MLRFLELPARHRTWFTRPLVVLLLVWPLSFNVDSVGQINPTRESKPPISLPDVRAKDPHSASQAGAGERQTRIDALAGRIAAAETEAEADALLRAESDLVSVELAQALFFETLRLRNTPVPRERILTVSLRLLRYVERSEIGPARGIAQRGAGVAYSNLENWVLAEQHLSVAISLFTRQGLGGRQDVIRSSLDLASVYHRKGDTRRALEQYQKVRMLARDQGDRESVVQAGNGMAAVYLQIGDFANAYSNLEQSLSVAETLVDKGPELSTLVQLASTFLNQGRLGKAVEAQEKAYRTAVESGSAARLNYLFQTAVLHIKLGDLPTAYLRFRRVIAESEKGGDQSLYFYSLLNVAQINERYGRYKKAAELYQRVIEIADEGLKDPSSIAGRIYVTGKVEAIARLAEMRISRGEEREAIDLYKQNLEVLGSAQTASEPDPRYQSKEAYAALDVSVRTSLADLYSSRGDRSEAESHYSSALVIAEKIRSHSGSIDTLLSMARHAAINGEPAIAGAYLVRAETYVQRHGRLDQLVKLRTTEAEVLVKLGRPAAADLKFQEALRMSESLRTDVTMPDQRASYFAGLFRPFDQYIDFLMERHAKQPDAGFDRRAFDVSERRRARALLDSLRVARADIRQGVDRSLLEEEERIRGQMNSAARDHFGGVEPLLFSVETDGEHLRAPAGSPKTDISYLAAELTRIETAIRKRSPRYAELMQPRPLRSYSIQALLDEDTILLNYTLGEKQSYLWAIDSRSVSSFVLPPRETIENLIKVGYAGMSDDSMAEERNTQAVPEAETLSRVLLGPVAGLMGGRRIVVVADGALQYLPFSSLPDPRQPDAFGRSMLLANEIQFAPSASVVSVLREDFRGREKASRSVAIFADPVFSENDERLGGRTDERELNERSAEESITRDLFLPRIGKDEDWNGKPNIARLPFSRREADAIFDSSPAGSSIKAVDFEASRERMASIDLSAYRIVHFATHGILNSEQPELSGIVLSLVNEKGEPVNGFLRLNEIYNMKLNADLVVLSACQTALGKEVRGEGLIGLTRGFMYAGTPRVVASLWKVDDVATAELMKIFYQKMLKEKMRPAAALREAKITMMKQKRWAAPYYWAAFELQGDWR